MPWSDAASLMVSITIASHQQSSNVQTHIDVIAQPPTITAYMMRPGTNVNSPAITSAPTKRPSIARRCYSTLCLCARHTATGSITNVKIANR